MEKQYIGTVKAWHDNGQAVVTLDLGVDVLVWFPTIEPQKVGQRVLLRPEMVQRG